MQKNTQNLQVLNGNNLELLKQYPDNYFDSVVTDPPYGLGKEPNAEELMKDWVEKGFHEITGSGFMGKEWDAFIPQPIFWKEVFRVLKPGGHVLSFFGTRTYDWGVMAMRFAGFEVRDCIQWVYGSGFPKSFNVAKGIEGKIVNGSSNTTEFKKLKGEREVIKSGYTKMQFEHGIRPANYNDGNGGNSVTKVDYETEEAKKWDGWGSALKPANEPIVLARKPLEKGMSIAENVMKWGTGAININCCRIGLEDSYKPIRRIKSFHDGQNNEWLKLPKMDEDSPSANPDGRFPSNFILTHHPKCECIGTKKVKTGKDIEEKGSGGIWKESTGLPVGKQYGDENGEEIIEDWDCHEDCPIKILDDQSGELKGGIASEKNSGFGDGIIFGNNSKEYIAEKRGFGDKGGASRFFYVAKASKSERNFGLDEFEAKRASAYGYEIGLGESGEGMFKDRNPIKQNFHPTVKPVKLMQYLVRMITQPNGIVLDPFCGSGTTGCACKLEGFEFVGMEQDAEYSKIAQARIDNYVEEEIQQKIKEQEKKEIKEQLKLF